MFRRFTRLAVHFRGYAVLVLGTGLTRGLSLVTAVIIARTGSPTRFGEISVFLAIVTLWTEGDFLDSTLVRYASAAHNETARTRYLKAALFLKVAWNVLLLMLAVPVAWAVSHGVFNKPVLFYAIFVAIVCAVGLNLLSLRAAFFQSQERFALYTATTSLFYILAFLFVVAIAVTSVRRDTMPIYYAYLLATVIVGMFGLVSIVRIVRRVSLERQVIKRIASFAGWLLGANLAYMVTQRLDILLLTGFASLAVVGQYGAALRVVATVSLLTGTLAPALLPRAARARRSPQLLLAYLRHAAPLSALIILCAGALWLAVPLVVRVMFGEAYSDAVPIVRILLIGPVCSAMYTPLSQLFLAQGEPRKMLYLSFLRLGSIATLGVLLIPPLRASGAALAVGLTEAVALAYVALSLRSQLAAALRVWNAKRLPHELPAP